MRPRKTKKKRPSWQSTTVIRWSVDKSGVVVSVSTTTTGAPS